MSAIDRRQRKRVGRARGLGKASKASSSQRLKFYNVRTKQRLQIPTSETEEVKRGPTLFYVAKDPKTGDKLWRIKGRA
jgi:hypothetical protein